jgi:hypothetical protein
VVKDGPLPPNVNTAQNAVVTDEMNKIEGGQSKTKQNKL